MQAILWSHSYSIFKFLLESLTVGQKGGNLQCECLKNQNSILEGHSKSTSLVKGGGGSGVEKVTQVGKGAAKKVITVTQILWVSVFVQLSFFSSVSHEVLITLHWATMKKSSNRLSLCVQQLFHQIQTIIIPYFCLHGLLIHVCLCVKVRAHYSFRSFLSPLM